ncbi:HAD family hydrolase [Thalassotalea crassostreae]|uniref:HAD family hydrolase n=1 Tax=Thalassotalea crassostreae TaxID=1763536 RepID=UPI0008385334|nr:HAD family hydrolase [Thalassotalea crassostreae]
MQKNKYIRAVIWLSLVFTFNWSAVAKDPLPSWNDGVSKQTIINFVERVTDPENPDFVAKGDRIATFDNDGTLWAEQPLYAQLMFAIERIHVLAEKYPEWKTKQPFSLILKGDIKGALSAGDDAVMDIVMAANAGMTNEQYTEIVKEWMGRATHPVSKKKFSEMIYQPMLELINYLKVNDFKNYIVSGGGIEFIRAWSDLVYGIPAEQIVGTIMVTKYEEVDGKRVIVRYPEMSFYNNKHNKVIGISNHIGKRPIAAFGNSDGDIQMLQYTTSGQGARLGMIIHHTDEKREWAYDRKSKIGHLSKGLDMAKELGWTVVDMKNEWKSIYPNSN